MWNLIGVKFFYDVKHFHCFSVLRYLALFHSSGSLGFWLTNSFQVLKIYFKSNDLQPAVWTDNKSILPGYLLFATYLLWNLSQLLFIFTQAWS